MVHVSPSQVHTWRACRRKWSYSRIRPRAENRFALFGTNTHSQLEGWLRDQTPPDWTTPEGKCAIAGLHLLPPPKTVAVEVPLELEFEGVLYVGHIDALGYQDGLVTIIDHKTTGDFKWAKTTEELEDDPQWIIYGYWAVQAFKAERAQGRWVYYRRKPPAAEPRDIVATAEELTRRFRELHERDGKAIVAAAGLPPEELPRNMSHCDAYGGCPYRLECLDGVSTIDRAQQALRGAVTTTYRLPHAVFDALRQEWRSESMTIPTLQDVLNANVAGAPPAQAPAPDVPPQVLALLENPPPGLDVEAIKKHYGIVDAAPAPVPAQPAPEFKPELPTWATKENADAAYKAVIAAGGTDATALEEHARVLKGIGNPPVIVSATDPRPPEAQAPKKRGRPKGSKNSPPTTPPADAPASIVVVSDAPVMPDAKPLRDDAIELLRYFIRHKESEIAFEAAKYVIDRGL